jgi:membrane protein implicated in regulation of membrane protease activity
MLIFMSLYDLNPLAWILIIAILLISLIALAIYTYKLYQRVPKDDTPLIGQEAVVVVWDGRDRRVEVFGAIWKATQTDDNAPPLKIGDVVVVRAIHNLVLHVTPTGETA